MGKSNERNFEYIRVIIIGAGPAGITAAIYAARKKMDFIVLTTDVGGQVTFSSEIENYTGFQYITGEELGAKFQEHLERHKFDSAFIFFCNLVKYGIKSNAPRAAVVPEVNNRQRVRL